MGDILGALAPDNEPMQAQSQRGPQKMPPQGQNPGGIDAIRNSVRLLMQMGMSEEDIVQLIMTLVERLKLNLDENQVTELVRQTAGQMPSTGGAPPEGPMGGGMPE